MLRGDCRADRGQSRDAGRSAGRHRQPARRAGERDRRPRFRPGRRPWFRRGRARRRPRPEPRRPAPRPTVTVRSRRPWPRESPAIAPPCTTARRFRSRATPQANFARIVPPDFALFSQAQYARPGFPFAPFEAETPVRWTSVVDLATGEEVRVPAPFVWLPYPYFRSGGELPIAPASAAGLGCAHGLGAAALAGLCDVIARDALALFWHASITPPQVRHRRACRRISATSSPASRRPATVSRSSTSPATTGFRPSPRWSRSSEPERPAFVLAGAAGLDPAAAIANALGEAAGDSRA